MTSKFAIGQRVQVVRLGDWNGTPPDPKIAWVQYCNGTVREINCDTVGVEIRGVWMRLGVLQFLPDELAVLDNTSGDSVE